MELTFGTGRFWRPARIARIARVARVLAHGALAACTGAQPARADRGPAVALPDVTVIDGTGAPPRPHTTVLVEGGRISALLPAGQQPLPRGVRVLDVAGAYVMPGLIDAHVHLATFERPPAMLGALLRHALLGGVTTVRDMGGNAGRVAALAAAARPDSAPMPRIFFSAVVAGPAWFAGYDPERLRFWSDGRTPGTAPGVRVLTDTTDVAAVVREAAALGATGIKVYADVPPARLAALAAEAHRRGLRLWSHAVVPPTRPEAVVAAGVDVVSHADQLIWAAAPATAPVGDRAARRGLLRAVAPDAPAVTALLDTMRARGTLLEPTLLVMQLGAARQEGAPSASLDTLAAWAVGVTRRAHALGVPVVAGTDALGRETPNIHAELQLLVRQAGLSPLEAIRAATQHGAAALGIADSAGTVAVGKWADLVVLRANPANDIRNTQTIRYVVRRGHVHARTAAWEPPQLASPPPR
jgi:imidazolonepropionase-like amidohydrolase